MTTEDVSTNEVKELAGDINADALRLNRLITEMLELDRIESGDIAVWSKLFEGNAEVSVEDQGQGIPPEFISRIFGRYERYEGAGKTQVVGTGLGLAIAQQIIQLHKGRIWVESAVGQGSTFRFTIPATAESGNKVA